MQPVPPRLIKKIIITTIKMKNMSGTIHQNGGQGMACHQGHACGGAGVCSAANTDDVQARLRMAERKQVRVHLIMDIGSSFNRTNFVYLWLNK
jgi:hypothetical protein